MQTMLSARLYVFDGSERAPYFAQNQLSLQPEQVEYCLSLISKTRQADTTRQTRFDPAGDAAALFDSYQTGEEGAFFDAFAERFLNRIRAAGVQDSGFDLLTCFYQEEDGGLWFAAFRLPYQRQFTHDVRSFGEGWRSELIHSPGALPFAGSRTVSGVLVDFSTCDVYLREVSVKTADGMHDLMGGIVLDTQEALSPAESIREVQKIALRLSDDQTPPWEDASDPEQAKKQARAEKQQQVRGALARSLDRTGTLDMQYIAQEVFVDDPATQERFHEAVESRGMEDIVPIESDRIRASLDKVKFSTDTGIQITLPRQIADDAHCFEIIHNPDGSISIEIRNIQSVRRA